VFGKLRKFCAPFSKSSNEPIPEWFRASSLQSMPKGITWDDAQKLCTADDVLYLLKDLEDVTKPPTPPSYFVPLLSAELQFDADFETPNPGWSAKAQELFSEIATAMRDQQDVSKLLTKVLSFSACASPAVLRFVSDKQLHRRVNVFTFEFDPEIPAGDGDVGEKTYGMSYLVTREETTSGLPAEADF
jgi:hypothetical protein